MTIFSFIFGVYPLAYSVFLSVTPFTVGAPKISFIGLANYLLAFRDSFFTNSIFVTLLIGGSAVALELALGLGLAILLNQRFRGVKAVRIAFLFPLMTPPIIVGIIWKTLLLPQTGPFAALFSTLGLVWPNILGTSLARVAVILMDVWQYTPFVMLILLAGLHGIPPQVLEAAQIDGAKPNAMFRQITLPLLAPVMIVAVIFRLVTAVKMFDTVYVLTQGGPFFTTDVISLFVLRTFVFSFQLAYASAASIIFMVIMFCLAIALVKVMRWSTR